MKPTNDLTREFLRRYPGEAARTLEQLPPAMVGEFLAAAEPEHLGGAVGHMPAFAAATALQAMAPERGAKLLAALDTATQDRTLRALAQPVRDALMAALPARQRGALHTRLTLPEGSAGAAMDPAPFLLPADVTVSEALKRLQRATAPVGCEVFVVDREQHLVGAVTPARLLRSRRDQQLHSLVVADVPVVELRAPLTGLVGWAAWKRYSALPVIARDGTVAGVVPRAAVTEVGAEGVVVHTPGILGAADVCWSALGALLVAAFGGGAGPADPTVKRGKD